MSASSATLLGGGLSWLARKHGIGANHVTAAELVTADGTLRRVDREHEPDLFWAIRGGGGDFGIVTALEFDLFPLTEVYAGVLWFPVERAGEVLRAWRDWTNGVPDEMTSVGRIMQFPPLPFFPDEIRGKSFALVEAIWCGDELDGAAWLEPLRALGPVLDTVQTIPVQQLSRLHMDPEEPAAGVGDGGMLTGLDDDAIEEVVAGTVGAPILSTEIRHLGGAVARAAAHHGAVASFDESLRHLLGRDRPDPGGPGSGPVGGGRPARSPRAVGGAAHVSQLQRRAAAGRDALQRGRPPPAAEGEGRVRPAGGGPVEPPRLVTGSTYEVSA